MFFYFIMGLKETRRRIKIWGLNVYFIVLLFVLILKYKSIQTLPEIFIYGSTIIIMLHIWWGAFIIVKYLKLKSNPALFLLNLMMLISLFFIPFLIQKVALWALTFSLFFGLVIVGYSILYNLNDKENTRAYIRKKIHYEMLAPLLFLLLYLFLRFIESESLFLILCMIVFVGQILFTIFLFRIKRVYDIVKHSN